MDDIHYWYSVYLYLNKINEEGLPVEPVRAGLEVLAQTPCQHGHAGPGRQRQQAPVGPRHLKANVVTAALFRRVCGKGEET